MNRILLVGSDQVWSLEKIYIRYLLQEGATVELFAAQNLFYAYNAKLINKLRLRLGIAGIHREINRQLREKIEAFRPDVIWAFKGMEVMPETLAWAREKGIKTANYNPDNPFIFSGRGSGNKFIEPSIPLYDLHFTYNEEVKKRLEDQYRLRTAMLPFGFEVKQEVFDAAAAQPEVLRACFLGNPDRGRTEMIEKLVEAGIGVDLYGNDWDKFLGQRDELKIFPAVYGDQFWQVLRRYRVQLNFMRIHNLDSHNMRSFEIPGIGGIMLAPATTEHKRFFTANEEAFFFAPDGSDLAARAKEVLSLTETAAQKVRERARQRSVASGYSYESRVKGAYAELKKL